MQIRCHRPVAEGTDPGEPAFGAGLAFAINQEVPGMRAIERVQDRLRREETRAGIHAARPVSCDSLALGFEIQFRELLLLAFVGKHEVGNLDDDRTCLPGPQTEAGGVTGRRCVIWRCGPLPPHALPYS